MPAKDYNSYMRDYMLRRYYERRQEAFELLGNQCTSCASTSSLEIDHVDWRKKTLALNKLWNVSKTRFLKELEECQLLCSDCHKIKTKVDLAEQRKGR